MKRTYKLKSDLYPIDLKFWIVCAVSYREVSDAQNWHELHLIAKLSWFHCGKPMSYFISLSYIYVVIAPRKDLLGVTNEPKHRFWGRGRWK